MSKAHDMLLDAVGGDDKLADALYAAVSAENVEHIRFHAAEAAIDPTKPFDEQVAASGLVAVADGVIAKAEADAGWWREVVK